MEANRCNQKKSSRTRTAAAAVATVKKGSSGGGGGSRGFEENTLAILDSSSIKDSRDVHDDRICFLEAVRSAAFASRSASAPSWRVYDAIFGIMRDGNSLELAMSSYQLLMDLDKRYPRVFLKESDRPESSSGAVGELIMAKEAWSPFVLSSTLGEVAEGTDRDSHQLFDSLRFSTLIEDIPQALNRKNLELVMKHVENMLLFKYLVSVLEADFLPRVTLYKEIANWGLVRESLLNILLGSKKLNFKNFVRDCMSIILKLCYHHMPISLEELRNTSDACPDNTGQGCNVSVAIAVSELEKQTCVGMQKLLTLVMELDLAKKEADSHGSTTRVDGFRTPISEIIVDELAYNKDQVSSFFLVFSEPKWKLEIIVQYFSKYCKKSSVRTRRSNEPSNATTFGGVLSYLSTSINAKNIAKKVTSEVVRGLLAHAFQASLSLLHGPKHIANSTERVGGTLHQICNSLTYAFRILRKVDQCPLCKHPDPDYMTTQNHSV